ncbi:MAG: cell division protein FtsZ [Bacteroidetes bacterium]|nr:cell division protein FtsZ [Bacteroidota bacterium]
MSFVTIDRARPLSAVLKVIGTGGGGCNAVDSMILKGLTGVDYVAINTDAQALERSKAEIKIQIGTGITRGLGAGADPNVGRKAIEEDREKITKMLDGSDMVFVTAGMGGGTGTGCAPVVASIAKSLGALVIGIVTKPFRWEGKRRMLNAEKGIEELRQFVDSLIVIPNERIISVLDSSVSAVTAFDKPNEVLYEATRGIADIITIPGIINVDFADVRSVMNQSGDALMGCGIASGDDRAIRAAKDAITSPLLEGINIRGAKNLLLNVSGSSNLTMQEIEQGNQIIYEAAGEEANVIFGLVNKEDMNDYVSYTVIATNFNPVPQDMELDQLKPQPAERRTESFIPVGGFDLKNMNAENQEELEIPTIFRVKGSSVNVPVQDTIPETGFRTEQIDAFSTLINPENETQKNKKAVDNDSSSFLRMMMD